MFAQQKNRRLGRLALTVAVFLVVVLAGGSRAWAANTDSDGDGYSDAKANVAAGPAPFNTTFTGGRNVALGDSMLPSLTSGSDNVALDNGALYSDTSGHDNLAGGTNALFSNTTGANNVASGSGALFFNNGDDNVASGYKALYSNNGSDNVASGYKALYSNTTGNDNLATGPQAPSLSSWRAAAVLNRGASSSTRRCHQCRGASGNNW